MGIKFAANNKVSSITSDGTDSNLETEIEKLGQLYLLSFVL